MKFVEKYLNSPENTPDVLIIDYLDILIADRKSYRNNKKLSSDLNILIKQNIRKKKLKQIFEDEI